MKRQLITAEFAVPSQAGMHAEIFERVQRSCSQAKVSFADRDLFAIRLSIEEMFVNAVKHGNGSDPSKKVRISYAIDDSSLTMSIEDEGPGFDPEDIPDPLAPENIERPCGRGIMLTRYYMTEVLFERNRVIMKKEFLEPEEESEKKEEAMRA